MPKSLTRLTEPLVRENGSPGDAQPYSLVARCQGHVEQDPNR